MGNLNLTAITDQTPYVQKIKGALEKVTGQSIPRRKFNSIPKQLSEKMEQEKQLDQEIADKTTQRDQLLQQLEQAKTQSA